jgi:hypothetical protein
METEAIGLSFEGYRQRLASSPPERPDDPFGVFCPGGICHADKFPKKFPK